LGFYCLYRVKFRHKKPVNQALLSIEQTYRTVRKALRKSGVTENAGREAVWLMTHVTGLERTEQICCRDQILSKTHTKDINFLLERRLSGEPLDNILGHVWFYGRRFDISKDVLSPRPETELLVEQAVNILRKTDKPRVLDLGVGSGAILVSCLAECDNAIGVGVDLSQAALNVARQNAAAHQVEAHIELLQSRWFENVTGQFDLILSNPPYISDAAMYSLPGEVVDYDPDLALRGEADGLGAYRDIISRMHAYLTPGGKVLFETGYDQGPSVRALLEATGFTDIRIRQDLSGHDRIVYAA